MFHVSYMPIKSYFDKFPMQFVSLIATLSFQILKPKALVALQVPFFPPLFQFPETSLPVSSMTTFQAVFPHNSKRKWSEVAQSCPILCNPMNCSLTGSSNHGIFQARVLEWGAIAFSRRSSLPRDWTRVSHVVGKRFTIWATREAVR